MFLDAGRGRPPDLTSTYAAADGTAVNRHAPWQTMLPSAVPRLRPLTSGNALCGERWCPPARSWRRTPPCRPGPSTTRAASPPRGHPVPGAPGVTLPRPLRRVTLPPVLRRPRGHPAVDRPRTAAHLPTRRGVTLPGTRPMPEQMAVLLGGGRPGKAARRSPCRQESTVPGAQRRPRPGRRRPGALARAAPNRPWRVTPLGQQQGSRADDIGPGVRAPARPQGSRRSDPSASHEDRRPEPPP